MTYETIPGTIPHRVVEFFKTQPPGTELSAAELEEQFGYPNITASLAWSIQHGALFKEVRIVHGRRIAFYRLSEADTPQLRTVDTEPVAAEPVAAKPVKKRRANKQPAPAAAPDLPITMEEPEPEKFHCGLTIDNGLIIRKGGFFMELTIEEADLLVRVAKARWQE